MLVWLVISINCIMAFVGFKKGLYVMIATLFNQLFAIFGAVLSTPKILSLGPGLEQTGYYAAIILFLLYVIIFSLLQFLSWFFFLRHREDYFPIWIDKVISMILGFLCGHFICSIVLLSLCVGVSAFVKEGKYNWFCTRQKLEKLTVPGLVHACDFLAWYSLECFDGDSESSIDHLLNLNSSQETELMGLPSLQQISEESI